MLIDIFSSFDVTEFNSIFPINFIFLLLIAIFILYSQSSYWLTFNRIYSIISPLISIIFTQLIRTTRKHIKGFTLIITSLFLLINIVNLIGLIPYTFRVSSHLIFTLTLGLPLWFRLILSSIIFNTKAFIAHFLPDGAPLWLNPFLVLIETTRIVVRPLTLSFRLAANIRAGHIVLGLIGIYTRSSIFRNFNSLIILTFLSTGYLIFEIAICVIQAYIFCLLLSLYADDHSH